MSTESSRADPDHRDEHRPSLPTLRSLLPKAFTLIELLVVIAIVAILAAILFPVFAQAKAAAKLTQCASNSHQMGLASLVYMGDHDDTYAMNRLPDPAMGVLDACGRGDWGGSRFNWRHSITPYVKSMAMRACPTNERAWSRSVNAWNAVTLGDEANPAYPQVERVPASYAYGGYFHETYPFCPSYFSHTLAGGPRPRNGTEINDPANLILIGETNLRFPDAGHWALQFVTWDGVDVFHAHGAKNMAWTLADGHTKALRLARTVGPKQMWTDDPADQTYIEGQFKSGAARNPDY